MMFPLNFHYKDISRQDPLLKPNHANVMGVHGSFEIRLVPTSDLKIQFGKLAMEIPHGKRFIQTQGGSYFQAGKSFRSNPFLGSKKKLDMSVTLHDKASLRA